MSTESIDIVLRCRVLSVIWQRKKPILVAVEHKGKTAGFVAMKAVEAVRDELLNYLVMQDTEQSNSMNPDFLNRKLLADERLASNQVQAVRKMIEYDLAIMNVHRAQGTLQRYNNVKLAEEKP